MAAKDSGLHANNLFFFMSASVALENNIKMRIFKQAIEQFGASKFRDRSTDLSRGKSESLRYGSPEQFFQQSPPPPPSSIQKKESASLTRQFFTLMASSEEKFQNTPSNDLMNNLVGMYQQCVEIYDRLQDPIKYYFVEKIQNVLAEIQTKKQKNQASGMRGYTIQIQPQLTFESSNNSLEEFHDANVELSDQKEESKSCNLAKDLNISQDWNQPMSKVDEEEYFRANQRAKSRKISIIKQLNEGEEQSQNQMKFLLSDYQNQSQNTDLLIKNCLDNQEQDLKARLRRRSESGMKRQLTHSLISNENLLRTPRESSKRYNDFM